MRSRKAAVLVLALALSIAPGAGLAQRPSTNVTAPTTSSAASSPEAEAAAAGASGEAGVKPTQAIKLDRTVPSAQSPDAATPAATASSKPPPAHAHPTLSGLPEATQTSEVIRIALVMTLLMVIPAIAICMTPFVRIVVVLSMIRHAFGMPETPPNQVLISLALFLTAFTMAPTLQAVNSQALSPFLAGSMSMRDAMSRGSEPLRVFMLRQVHDQDIKTVYDMSKKPLPARAADVDLINLTPAFMLNELRVSFKIGFVIFLPFLLIDIVVSSVLLSLGMLMVPPATISLPIKILMFVLIDGWSLVLQSVVGSIR